MPPTNVALQDSDARTRRALAAGGVAGVLASFNEARTLYAQGKEVWQKLRVKRRWTVELSENDLLFDDVLDWVESLVTSDQRRNLTLRSVNVRSRTTGNDIPSSETGTSAPQRRLQVAAAQSAKVDVEWLGHRLEVGVTRPESPAVGQDQAYRSYEPDKLVFHASSEAGQQAVVDQVEALLRIRETADHTPVVRILDTRWSTWNYRGDLPPRPLESVVLREGQLERLVADLTSFLAAEADYNRRAIPWHRGYMLEGPAGTGKTSVARALASHFGMDMWYAPLGDVKDDSSLLSLLGQVHPRSVVLLEDVDVFAATREREAEKAGTVKVTLSGLLNALDGVATPHGLVTFLTTNQPEGLDRALTRAGRCDVVETLDFPDVGQAERLFKWFYGHGPRYEWRAEAIDGKSTADLIELYKQHIDDPRQAERALLGTRLTARIQAPDE